MEELVARGMTRLLVEGGPAMWRAFADLGLADDVALYHAGGGANEAAALECVAHWLGPLPLAVFDQRRLGPDRLWRLRRVAEKKEG